MGLSAMALCVGCATNSTNTVSGPAYQFDPIPIAKVGEEELAPVAPQTVDDLLRAANEHFEAANNAQEEDDHAEALRHYTMMLEQLIEADLDPTVFYQLRSEFARILDSAEGETRLAKRAELPPWDIKAIPLNPKSRLEYPDPLNERVLTEISEIKNGYSKNFLRGLERSHRYMPYIRAEFMKAGLPSDLVWLAMVESQFTPRINSRVGAGGMWQFMPGTARRFGLTIDDYVDERYDWKKATQAAITYLTQLHDMFDGSWPLAVSAYNKGEYGMERAVAMGGGERDLWRLMEIAPAANHLPRETQKFYPRLLASAIVAENPRKHGFTPQFDAPERTVYLPVSGSRKLTDLEEAAKLPKGTLVALNPQLLRGVTPPGRTVEISVPVDMRAQVAAAIQATPEVPTGTHVVRRGETLARLADTYNTSVEALMRENDIKSPRKLRVGQRLVIPQRRGASPAPAPTPAPTPAPVDETPAVQLAVATTPSPAPAAAQATSVYKVAPGDSLSSIAAAHKVSVASLQDANDLGRRTVIHVGDSLRIPGNAVAAKPVVHVVRRGEFPAAIARKYGVSAASLMGANGLSTNATIHIGDKLLVPGATQPVPEASPRIHRVARGENASIIAAKYGVQTTELLSVNSLNGRSILKPGDELNVPAGSIAAEPAKLEHVVERGQNPTVIAKRYGVPLENLFTWNNWSNAPLLRVGDRVTVFTD